MHDLFSKDRPAPARHPVHLVGTVPLGSTDAVFDLLAQTIAPLMPRIPDGETGVRSYWVSSQARVLHESPLFEPDGHDWAPGREMPELGAPKYRLKAGVDPATVEIGSFGYGAFAQESYASFRAMKAEGRLPADARFQVGLPTPLGFYTAIVAPVSQADVAHAFEARMAQELKDVMAAVPADELAIQWDCCLEIFVWEGIRTLPVDDDRQEVIASMVRLGNLVPEPVQLGYHLCYGDFRHKHGVEPKDTANMVTIANALTQGVARAIDWIHMPVPRERNDDAYFAPLRDLALRPETGLFLGLVHYTDGEEGTRRRMATAERFVASYGIATECGLGRRDPTTIPDLLKIHACCAD
ncbi:MULTISPECIES: hypothetical protein [unclassified Sphingomonas]|uniref:hypothetical protein n=1 Tax=unclassified Sphingomonas TaxID=196159 RepID=UPI0006F9D426|nr:MULTISPECIES: hypothetical protein [unclassified Sphingomonas]KQX19439.1 hypothetical protein ASD17_12970 [Sphingomonas sp. Root1294]KQY65640.1 hypothetical protein ASD39_16170 [Sphingomonas sp. Root50]KRB95056.1 hypothetical protein ASE22_03885 [Sphingomonas sp. Root720]